MALACMAVWWASSPSLLPPLPTLSPVLAALQDQSSGQVPGDFCGTGEAPGGDHPHLPEAAAPGFAARCAGVWHGPFPPRSPHPAGAPRALEPGGPSQSIHLLQGQFQGLCLGGGQETQTGSQLSRTISLHFLETEGPRTWSPRPAPRHLPRPPPSKAGPEAPTHTVSPGAQDFCQRPRDIICGRRGDVTRVPC